MIYLCSLEEATTSDSLIWKEQGRQEKSYAGKLKFHFIRSDKNEIESKNKQKNK